MFIFDQFKKDDRSLQVLSICVLAGMFVLLADLWRVQIVSNKRYETTLKNQAFKTIRMPAIRGKILDRNGEVLVENQGRVNVNLYLEELPDQFAFEYTNVVRKEYLRKHPEVKRLSLSVSAALKREARYRVVSNITFRVSSILKDPKILDLNLFLNHYTNNPFVPYPILCDLKPNQVAIYSEQLANQACMELEIQPVRRYPHGTLAAHLLGYVRRHDKPDEDDEEALQYKYFLPDFEGQTGVEGAFDAALHGTAGVKRVLVNNVGYRQREKDNLDPPLPGDNIYLTIDLALQAATEKALIANGGPGTQGAAIVMDVRNGDILAMASSPTYDPNIWVDGVSESEYARLNDEKAKHMFNRATFGAYPPGSTFKIVTGIACLESGLNPKELFHSVGEFRLTPTSRPIGDEADEGDYDFERAFYKSSNTYFCHFGMLAGLRRLLETGKRFHLGERTDIATKQEVAGSFPTPEEAVGVWSPNRTADACIGQEITVTPLQMTVLTAAIANGDVNGCKLFWPRIVTHLRSQDTGQEDPLFSQGRIRETIKIKTDHLEAIRHAMLLDTEQPGASAYNAFHHPDKITPYLPNMHVGGKTGTAEISYPVKDKVTWFVSYAPFENPRYAVVVMIEHGTFGGITCAPVARQIYEAIEKREATAKPGVASLNGEFPRDGGASVLASRLGGQSPARGYARPTVTTD